MKRRKIYLTALCILLTGTTFATAFQERTENWSTMSCQYYPPEEPYGDEWGETPIGDALPLILTFGLVYMAVKKFKNSGRSYSYYR
jgi:hypothetical protein